MTIQEILNTTHHRPWEVPQGNWKFYQEWNNAIFLHWEVELTELKKLVPKELEIDTIDGKPWVSLVAFTMEKLRPSYLPYFAPVSNFDEINIRTYVKSKEKSGVYFLNIEAGNKLSSFLANKISELPYHFSKIERTENQFLSKNTQFGNQLNIEYTIDKTKPSKDIIDKWLTERYALFQESGNDINEFEIHHIEWPINKLNLIGLDLNYPQFNNFISNKPDRVHYSKGVQVIAWGMEKKNKSVYNQKG